MHAQHVRCPTWCYVRWFIRSSAVLDCLGKLNLRHRTADCYCLEMALLVRLYRLDFSTALPTQGAPAAMPAAAAAVRLLSCSEERTGNCPTVTTHENAACLTTTEARLLKLLLKKQQQNVAGLIGAGRINNLANVCAAKPSWRYLQQTVTVYWQLPAGISLQLISLNEQVPNMCSSMACPHACV